MKNFMRANPRKRPSRKYINVKTKKRIRRHALIFVFVLLLMVSYIFIGGAIAQANI